MSSFKLNLAYTYFLIQFKQSNSNANVVAAISSRYIKYNWKY